MSSLLPSLWREAEEDRTLRTRSETVSNSSDISSTGKEKSTMKIDAHAHVEIGEALALLPLMPTAPPPQGLSKSDAYNIRMVEALRLQLREPEKKMADMEKMGLDLSILSIAPNHFFYHLDGNLALDVCRAQNEGIADLVRKYPRKFAGMANVPLQNAEAAAAELERSVQKLQLVGVEVATNVRGKYLGNPGFDPFLAKAAELDIPVFIHPDHVAGKDRLADFYFSNLVGNPLDTTIAAGTLIFSGALDRFPRLKIVLAHAGGNLPYIIDRMGQGFRVRPECREFIKKSPVEYLSRFYFDTIAHGKEALQFLVTRVGADRVLLGTDYPYDMADMNPLRSIESVPGLTAPQREKIAGQNAVSLFKLKI
jgi:aminocarboxymuconate-semialdehyde decarboxylase